LKRKHTLLTSIILLFLTTTILVSPLQTKKNFILPQMNLFLGFERQSKLIDIRFIDEKNKTAFNSRLTNPQKTIEYANSALILSKKINYIFGLAEANRIKGVGFYYLGNIDQSVKCYLEALKYYKSINDKKNEARVFNNIGNLYKEVNYVKAILHYKKALKIANKLNIPELTAGIYLNIATILGFQKDFKNSLEYLEMCKEIFTKTKDTINYITVLQNSGVIYYELKDFETAKNRLHEAKNFAIKNKLYKAIIGSNLTLVTIYLEQKEYSKAEIHINEGIEYSKILKDNNSFYHFLYKAYELEEIRKKFAKALKHLKEVYHHDSILLSRNVSDNIGKTSLHYWQIQKIEEKELIIAQQKYKETQFWWIITIIISIVLSSAFIGIVIILISQKRKQKKELETQNTIATLEQKALQAMMNPHFVFNVINTIQYFIGINESKAANQILTGFARLMRKHLEICLKSSITLFEEIQYLNLYLSLEKLRFADKMNYAINIVGEIESEDIIIPSMLIQPFIENAVWHGILPKEDGGSISIDFKNQNNQLSIKILDDGIGISNSTKSKSPSKHTSRGLQLIHERISLLNKINKTSINISQRQTGESGTEVLITIPI
jgi:tetratricopeptide (TPR) repeat protein